MREILFKAKRKNWTELPKEQWWVVGVPMKIENKNMMLLEDNDNLLRVHYTDDEMWCAEVYAVEIDIDTLCQYTGLTDKNGNKIWEVDIIKYITYENVEPVGTVIWDKAEFRISWNDDRVLRRDLFFWTGAREIEVIGNIFDNKELLEK